MNNLHTTVQNSVQELQSIGVVVPSIQDAISVPSDFSHIPNFGENNIGDLMGRIASYISYLEYQSSIAEVDHEAWNSSYEFEKKKIMLTLETERRDIMEAKADVQLEQQKQNLMLKYSKVKLIKSLLDGQKRLSDALSRELSRRSLVLQMQRGGL